MKRNTPFEITDKIMNCYEEVMETEYMRTKEKLSWRFRENLDDKFEPKFIKKKIGCSAGRITKNVIAISNILGCALCGCGKHLTR